MEHETEWKKASSMFVIEYLEFHPTGDLWRSWRHASQLPFLKSEGAGTFVHHLHLLLFEAAPRRCSLWHCQPPHAPTEQCPEKAFGVAKTHTCLQSEGAGLTYTRMVSIKGMWAGCQQRPLRWHSAFLNKLPSTRTCISVLVGWGLWQEGSRNSWHVEGLQRKSYNYATLPPTQAHVESCPPPQWCWEY